MLLSTPRAGNNWLRYLLARAYDIPGAAIHAPAEVDWEGLPRECVLGIHWHPHPSFLERLERHGFRAVVVARHPLDLFLSILHFALHHSGGDATQRWLEGEAGNERPIFAAMPRSTAFLNYCTGNRARRLLSVSHDWWHVSHCLRVRYEDLARDTAGELARLAAELGTPLRRPVAEVLEATTIPKLRAYTGSKAHFWQGQAGLWRRLLPAAEARALAGAHETAFADFGYACDPDPDLDAAQADANWIDLIWADLAEDLARLQTSHLVVRNLQATEQRLAAVQEEFDGAKAEAVEARRVYSELVGRFTAVQEQLLSVQVTYQDMVEKLTASQRALGEAQTRLAAAEAQQHDLRHTNLGLQTDLQQARELCRVTALQLTEVQGRWEAVADVGPRAIRLARKLQGWSRRFRRFTSLLRWLVPGRRPQQCNARL
jgi:hypothetical protein